MAYPMTPRQAQVWLLKAPRQQVLARRKACQKNIAAALALVAPAPGSVTDLDRAAQAAIEHGV